MNRGTDVALMLAHLNDALRKAGADEESARKASEEVAGYENRLSKVESDLMLLKWMVGTNLVITFGILWKVMTL